MDEGVGLYERKERTLDPGGAEHREPFVQYGGKAPSAGANRSGREDAEMDTATDKSLTFAPLGCLHRYTA